MMQEHLMTCSWEGWALHKVSTQQLFGFSKKKLCQDGTRDGTHDGTVANKLFARNT